MKRKLFCTLFPAYEDFHFWKDPGQIPYRFLKLGFNSFILCNNNGEYSDTTKYLKIEFLKNKKFWGYEIGTILYFLKNSKKIDILNIFHLDNWGGLCAAYIYKKLNFNGKVYLKMDNCHACGIYPWERIFDRKINPLGVLIKSNKSFKSKFKDYLYKKYFIKEVDLFSVEDEESKIYYEKKYRFFKDKIFLAYNGHTVDILNNKYKVKSFDEKEDIILTVGNLGTFSKNTMNLLKGYAYKANTHNWSLYLAGSVTKDFIKSIDVFFSGNPDLTGRVKFLGYLNKTELFSLYNRSKIFLLPSRFESFANVYSESMYFGNAIITSPNTSFKKLVVEKNLGYLVNPENSFEIGEAILKLINNTTELKKISDNCIKFAKENLDWDDIVNSIYLQLFRKK